MTELEILENQKETLTGNLYTLCADKIEVFKVNEYGLPIPEEQVELYYIKAKEAEKVIAGSVSITLALEAELTGDTVENLATIILYKRDVYETQLNYIEVVRRVISEKLTNGDINTAIRYIENFKVADSYLDESKVRAILV